MLMGRILLAAAIAASLFGSAAEAKMPGRVSGTARQRAEQACYGDATRLCGDAIPDEAKITACMGQKRAQLSPECRKIFDAGLKQ